jgi:hypothetical protein
MSLRVLAVVVAGSTFAAAPASAFCGTYVGSPGAELYSGASRVVLARQGSTTTLTFANDYQGPLREFALVVPVPASITAADVAVLDPDDLDQVDAYVAPRLVEYTCAELNDVDAYPFGPAQGCGCGRPSSDDLDTDSSSDPSQSGGTPLDVTVESAFAAGEYEIQVLSSRTAADLVAWLDQEGYGVSAEAEDMLGEYIEAGAYFFAAKVRLEEVPLAPGPEGAPYLSPLQVRYESEVFGLPIRLGTLNSPGTQDLLLTTLTGPEDGRVAISNYPEVEITEECMWDEERHGPLPAFIDGMMQEQVDAAGGAGWLTAYGWPASDCDPCPPQGSLDPSVVRRLGYEGDGDNAVVTRLWMRYEADAATRDIALYETGTMPREQLRYILYKPGIGPTFEVCGEGLEEDPGECEDAATARKAASLTLLPLGLPLGGLALVAGLRRRRR